MRRWETAHDKYIYRSNNTLELHEITAFAQGTIEVIFGLAWVMNLHPFSYWPQ